jgi:hypothetical protein
MTTTADANLTLISRSMADEAVRFSSRFIARTAVCRDDFCAGGAYTGAESSPRQCGDPVRALISQHARTQPILIALGAYGRRDSYERIRTTRTSWRLTDLVSVHSRFCLGGRRIWMMKSGQG